MIDFRTRPERPLSGSSTKKPPSLVGIWPSEEPADPLLASLKLAERGKPGVHSFVIGHMKMIAL